jgi:prophage tail gpP-like protein
MYQMDWHITVGKYRLALLDTVNIRRSVEQLADTAEIVLPGMAFGKTLDVESRISRGDSVVIQLGYDGDLTTEFVGFLQNISINGGSITLQCEDDIFKFRVGIPDRELVNISLKQLVQHVADAVGGYKVDCDYDFKYDKFVIHKATGFDVLKKVQEETLANI